MNNEYDYPMNLLSDIFSGDEEIIENIDTISDLNASVEYVLFRLTDRERKVIERRYKNNQTYQDIGKEFGVTRERIRQLGYKALRKLKQPSRSKYLTKGVNGVIEGIRTDYLNKIIDIERQLIELCKLNNEKADEIITDARIKECYKGEKLEELDFSVRTYNCLKRSGCNTISDLAILTNDELMKIRNLGKRSYDEIIEKLKEYGYER